MGLWVSGILTKLVWNPEGSMEKKGIKKSSKKMKSKTSHSRRSCADCFKEFRLGNWDGRRHCQNDKEDKWSSIIFGCRCQSSYRVPLPPVGVGE